MEPLRRWRWQTTVCCLTLIVYHIRAYFQGKMGGCYLVFRVGSSRIIREGAAIFQLLHRRNGDNSRGPRNTMASVMAWLVGGKIQLAVGGRLQVESLLPGPHIPYEGH